MSANNAVMPMGSKNLWSGLKSKLNRTWSTIKPSANRLWSTLKTGASNPLIQSAWQLAKLAVPQLSLVDEGINAIDRVIGSDDIVDAIGREAKGAVGKVVGGLVGGGGNPFMNDG